MRAAGMVFLSRGGARLTTDTQGVPTLTLMCLDRMGQHKVEPWALYWRGQAAADFFKAHQNQLQPGAPLQVEAEHLRSHTAGRSVEITGHLLSCKLLPAAQKAGHA